MAKTKITAPVAQPGEVTGVGGLVFTDGVAHTDDEAIIAYCESAGYGIGNSKPRLPESPELPDSREIHADGPEVVGTPLRDAAVDPEDGDFLPPVNAGNADPHGPKVVAPGIHALPPAPIVAGQVSDDDDPEQRGQEKRETAAAKAALVDHEPPAEITGQDGAADHGPLGLSDPGSVEQGVEAAEAIAAAAPAKTTAPPSTGTTAAPRKTTKRAPRGRR